MNTQSNAVPESLLDSQRIAPAAMSSTRPMYWSVRRELWENRSIYIAPLAVAAVTLFGFLIASIGRAMSVPDPARRAAVLAEPNNFAALLIMGAAFIVGVFYSLEALHGERRDRSILFWKSLPVSDLTTVLSKASIPVVVLPLLSFALTVATQWIMLLLSTAVMLGSGLSVAPLWTHMPLFQMWLLLLYHLLAVHVLWYAPIYGWLLLVSGWARRAAFLWAALPWLAIGIVEKLAFNTSHFAAWLGYRFSGDAAGGSFTADNVSMDPLMHLTPGKFFSTPGLWIGLAFFAACIAAAVRLRRYREPI
jgi:ABC-2 type transport system permease protein